MQIKKQYTPIISALHFSKIDILQLQRLKSIYRKVIISSNLNATVHTAASFHGPATLKQEKLDLRFQHLKRTQQKKLYFHVTSFMTYLSDGAEVTVWTCCGKINEKLP